MNGLCSTLCPRALSWNNTSADSSRPACGKNVMGGACRNNYGRAQTTGGVDHAADHNWNCGFYKLLNIAYFAAWSYFPCRNHHWPLRFKHNEMCIAPVSSDCGCIHRGSAHLRQVTNESKRVSFSAQSLPLLYPRSLVVFSRWLNSHGSKYHIIIASQTNTGVRLEMTCVRQYVGRRSRS